MVRGCSYEIFLHKNLYESFYTRNYPDLRYSKFAVPMYLYVFVVTRHPCAHHVHSNELAIMLKNSMLERDW